MRSDTHHHRRQYRDYRDNNHHLNKRKTGFVFAGFHSFSLPYSLSFKA
jgi:hypothetical protein